MSKSVRKSRQLYTPAFRALLGGLSTGHAACVVCLAGSLVARRPNWETLLTTSQRRVWRKGRAGKGGAR